MTVRKFGSIKSLLHFDYPYFNEPNDGLGDEVSSEVWTRVGNTKLVGNEIPYDVLGTQKFGYRCAYFPDTTSAIQGTNASGIFNLSPSGSYEIEAFVKYTRAGNIFTIGDLVFGVNSSSQLTLLSETSEITLTANTWQHILLRLKNGVARVFLDGIEVLSAALPAMMTEPEMITLGGYVGYMDEFCFRHSAGTGTPIVPTQPYAGKLNVNKVGGFGTGADGDVTISANSQINSYGMINAISDTKTFTVSSWSNGTYTPAVGSEIMIHITAPKSTASADYPLVGLYAFRKIESINGTTIMLDKEISTANGDDFTLDSTLLSTYYVQVIIVPNFNSLTVNSGITINPLTWGTSTGGGIVAFRCKGDCTINGNILTHGKGAIRYDWCQMTHSKLVDRFLCAQGGGIFATCGGTFTASTDARLGASWSGLGDTDGNGATGKGGKGGDRTVAPFGGVGGVGGGGGGMSYYDRSLNGYSGIGSASGGNVGSAGVSFSTDYYYGSGGGGCGGQGGNGCYGGGGGGGGGQGNSGGKGGSAELNVNKGENGTINGGNSGPSYSHIGGSGGGAPGGNGGVGNVECGGTSGSFPKGIAGSCIILICSNLVISSSSISTGGSASICKGYSPGAGASAEQKLQNVKVSKKCGGGGGGGTGFCYIAYKEQVSE